MRDTTAVACFMALSLIGVTAHAETIRDPRLVAGLEGATTRFHTVLPFQPLSHARGLRIGEQLKCRNACALELHDGTAVELGPGAELEASSPTFHRFDGEAMARRSMAIAFLSGPVTIERSARPTPFVMRAGGMTFTLPQGSSRLNVHPDRVAIVTGEGAVSLKRGPRWIDLAPRRLHVVTRGEVVTHPVVTAPVWRSEAAHHQPLALAVADPQGLVGGAFSPVAGAAGYRVAIAEDAAFSRLTRRLELPAEAEHFATTLSEGRYYARVTATDVEGMVSATSTSLTLRVLRAALPVDGFLGGPRTIVVPRDGRLRLLDAQDVEVSFDRRGFIATPSELPAPTRDAHQIELRLADDHATATSLRLEARSLRARVTMSPRLPAWPDDSIQASVVVEDSSGHVDPASFRPKLQVRIGSKPVPARWSRHGATWRTSIEGRYLGGPALVEVVALDDRGRWLGWGFVEVVAR